MPCSNYYVRMTVVMLSISHSTVDCNSIQHFDHKGLVRYKTERIIGKE